jgi:cell division transport system ATP-binding protein
MNSPRARRPHCFRQPLRQATLSPASLAALRNGGREKSAPSGRHNPDHCSHFPGASVSGYAARASEGTRFLVVRLNGVGLRYVRGSDVLQDITFHLRPGSFHFLTGPSGSGKTSLLRLLFMSIQPTRGALTLFGQDISRVTPARRAQLRRRIGIVFQDFRLLEHMTTWENVAMPLRVTGKKASEYKEDVTDLLQWVGLGDRMHSAPSMLSGGEKQRAAIARAVINKPELLLADEPTGNVDPQMGRRLLRLFIELNRLGTSVLIATHDHQLMRQTKAPRLELHDGHVRIV